MIHTPLVRVLSAVVLCVALVLDDGCDGSPIFNFASLWSSSPTPQYRPRLTIQPHAHTPAPSISSYTLLLLRNTGNTDVLLPACGPLPLSGTPDIQRISGCLPELLLTLRLVFSNTDNVRVPQDAFSRGRARTLLTGPQNIPTSIEAGYSLKQPLYRSISYHILPHCFLAYFLGKTQEKLTKK